MIYLRCIAVCGLCFLNAAVAASLVIDVIGGIITAVDTITVSMAASVTMTSAAIHVITAIISCHHQMSSLRVLTGNQINNQLWIK